MVRNHLGSLFTRNCSRELDTDPVVQRPRTPAFHAGNTGSNPVGVANHRAQLDALRRCRCHGAATRRALNVRPPIYGGRCTNSPPCRRRTPWPPRPPDLEQRHAHPQPLARSRRDAHRGRRLRAPCRKSVRRHARRARRRHRPLRRCSATVDRPPLRGRRRRAHSPSGVRSRRAEPASTFVTRVRHELAGRRVAATAPTSVGAVA